MKQLIMAAGLAVMLTACGTSEKKLSLIHI